jgi:hypothetical protein
MNTHPATRPQKLADTCATACSASDYECLTELLDEKIRMRHTSGDVDHTGAASATQMMKDFPAILPARQGNQRTLAHQAGR